MSLHEILQLLVICVAQAFGEAQLRSPVPCRTRCCVQQLGFSSIIVFRNAHVRCCCQLCSGYDDILLLGPACHLYMVLAAGAGLLSVRQYGCALAVVSTADLFQLSVSAKSVTCRA